MTYSLTQNATPSPCHTSHRHTITPLTSTALTDWPQVGKLKVCRSCEHLQYIATRFTKDIHGESLALLERGVRGEVEEEESEGDDLSLLQESLLLSLHTHYLHHSHPHPHTLTPSPSTPSHPHLDDDDLVGTHEQLPKLCQDVQRPTLRHCRGGGREREREREREGEIVPYSGKFSWEKIFANFANWRPLAKIFFTKIEHCRCGHWAFSNL